MLLGSLLPLTELVPPDADGVTLSPVEGCLGVVAAAVLAWSFFPSWETISRVLASSGSAAAVAMACLAATAALRLDMLRRFFA